MLKRLMRDRFLSDAELARFMEAVRTRHHKNQPRDHALFCLLANTGLRPSEALALTQGDVHASSRPPWLALRRMTRKHGVRPLTHLVLNAQVARPLRVFVKTLDTDANARLFPFTRRQSQRLFHYYGARAELDRPLKVYALRHTAGMRLWRSTRDIRLVQALLGHANMKATAAYVHVSPERIRDACERAGTTL